MTTTTPTFRDKVLEVRDAAMVHHRATLAMLKRAAAYELAGDHKRATDCLWAAKQKTLLR